MKKNIVLQMGLLVGFFIINSFIYPLNTAESQPNSRQAGPLPVTIWKKGDYTIDQNMIDRGDVTDISDILSKEPAMVKARSQGPIASNFSWTLLHAAVQSKNRKALEMCTVLIDYGAEIDPKDSEGNTPLHFAVNRVSRQGLPSSVYRGIIDLLLANGANVSSVNRVGATPLHLASIQGADLSTVEKLIQKGANINARASKEGGKFTPLHGAASAGRRDLVEFLLKHGANPNLKDGRNLTPPEIAKQQGHQSTVRAFNRLSGLKPQALPMISEIDLQLLEAARTGDNEHIPQLLSKGANPNVFGEDGYNALMLAAKYASPENVKALVDAGANMETEFYLHGATALGFAIEGKRYDVVTALLNLGANVNAQSYTRATSLITAAAQNDIEMARILLDAGADINMCNMHNKSALFAAVQMGHPEMVKLLLDSGADVNIRDFQSKTAFMHASQKGHTKIIEMLRATEQDFSQLSFTIGREGMHKECRVLKPVTEVRQADLFMDKWLYFAAPLQTVDTDKWLTWRLIDPKGNRINNSNPIPMEWYKVSKCFYQRFPLNHSSDPGTYRLVVDLNDQTLYEKSFNIIYSDPSELQYPDHAPLGNFTFGRGRADVDNSCSVTEQGTIFDLKDFQKDTAIYFASQYSSDEINNPVFWTLFGPNNNIIRRQKRILESNGHLCFHEVISLGNSPILGNYRLVVKYESENIFEVSFKIKTKLIP